MRWSLALLVGVLAPAWAWAQNPTLPAAVFVMNADGSDVRKVAEVKGAGEHAFPCWSHDGKQLAFNAKVGFADVKTCFAVNVDGSGLRELGRGEMPDFSPDDKQIALQDDGLGGAAEIYVQNVDGKSRAKIGWGRSPRWSPDGSKLAISDRNNVRVVDLLSGEAVELLDEAATIFNGFAWFPDGERLAVAIRRAEGGPRQLLFLDAGGINVQLQPRLKNEMGGVVSFTPDGKRLVYADAWLMYTFDVEGNAEPQKIPNQQGMARHPVFSPDGKKIAFVSTRRAPEPEAPKKGAQVPPTWKFEELARHAKGTIVYSLAFTPDARRLVIGCDPQNHGVQVWDIATGATKNLGGSGIRIQMFPDGRRFATCWHSPTIQIVDLDTGGVLREIDHGARMWVLSVSQDGRRLMSGGLDKVMRIWDVETGDLLNTHANLHQDWITRGVFSPDGKEGITVGHDQTLRVWDVASGKVRLTIKHPAAVWSLAVTPDGRHVLTGTGGSLQSSLAVLKIGQGPDNLIRMWDAASGQLVREMKGHTHVVYSIDVSSDGRLAASGSWDGTMRLWDLATGAELGKTQPGQGNVPFVAFSPDAKLIVTGGGARRINGDIVQFPNEEVRVYKVVEAAPTAAAGK